ncbi:5853_t:CDS:2, partial [Acaulospora colombiana]
DEKGGTRAPAEQNKMLAPNTLQPLKEPFITVKSKFQFDNAGIQLGAINHLWLWATGLDSTAPKPVALAVESPVFSGLDYMRCWWLSSKIANIT